MRIGVAQRSLRQQCAGLDQRRDHRLVGVAILLAVARQDELAGEQRDIRRERAVFLHHAERVGILGGIAGEGFRHQDEVFFAVAGRGVHEARAGVGGDVIARKDGHVEVVTLAAERMRRDCALRFGCTDTLERDLRVLCGLIGECIGKCKFFATLSECALACLRHFVESVVERRRVGDGAVAGNGPRRGRPDDDARAFQRTADNRKLYENRRRRLLVILDLGFGERGLLDRRPHHRAEAAIEQLVGDEFEELARDHGFGAIIHRGVGLVPQSHAAQPLELGALHVDPVLGEGAAILAQHVDRHVVLRLAFLAVLFLDLPFDRQAMAVPARNVGRVVAEEAAASDHDVLQHLVEAGARMNLAVGVGRTVMQHEERAALRLFANAAVKVRRLPAREPFGLGFRQAGAHGKFGLGQEQRGAVIARVGRGFGLGHVFQGFRGIEGVIVRPGLRA